jgi:ferredoxin-NADP reductase
MAAPERTATLAAVTDHGHDTRSLFLDLPGGMPFRPGQFVSCLLPVGAERLTRPYSIASSPEQPERLELLLNLVPDGPGSRHLFALPIGGTVQLTGPWGTFALDRAPDAETVFVADGTGIAPIRPMLHRAAATAKHPLHLLWATDHVFWRDELDAITGLVVSIIAPSALVDTVRARWVDADADRSRHFFVCGVGDVVPELRGMLRGAGYERRAVQYERW